MEQVMDLINDTDLTKMVNIIEKKVLEEEDCTSLDVAAALLKLAMGEENEDIIDCSRPARSLDDLDRYGRDGRGGRGRGGREGRYGRDGRGSRDGRYGRYDRDEEEDMIRLFVNIGKSQNVRPGDILGAVAGESGISGKMVGSIDMYDNYTFVDVPREYADAVLRAMKDVKIKGKNVHMEKANGRGR